jgi:hypothetical protein
MSSPLILPEQHWDWSIRKACGLSLFSLLRWPRGTRISRRPGSTSRFCSEKQLTDHLRSWANVALYIADWLRIAFVQFLSSQARPLMGIHDVGEWKHYAIERALRPSDQSTLDLFRILSTAAGKRACTGVDRRDVARRLSNR